MEPQSKRRLPGSNQAVQICTLSFDTHQPNLFFILANTLYGLKKTSHIPIFLANTDIKRDKPVLITRLQTTLNQNPWIPIFGKSTRFPAVRKLWIT